MTKKEKEQKDSETSMGISIMDLLKLRLKIELWQLAIIFIIGIVLGVMLK